MPRAIIDIHTTSLSSERLILFSHLILNHSLFRQGILKARAIFPNESITVHQLPFLQYVVSPCNKSRNGTRGLSCRIDFGNQLFLRTKGINWHFTAMDDTWFSPENMISYLNDLENIVDPEKHVVIKASKNDYFPKSNMVHSGCGWLESRAALERLHEINATFTDGVQYTPHQREDETLSAILWRLFRRVDDWNEDRMLYFDEDIYYPDRKENTAVMLRDLIRKDVKRKCDRSCNLVPVKEMLSLHARGSTQRESVIAYNKMYNESYYIARCGEEKMFACLDSPLFGFEKFTIKRLMERTPIIEKKDIPEQLFREKDRKCEVIHRGGSNEAINEFCTFSNPTMKYTYKSETH